MPEHLPWNSDHPTSLRIAVDGEVFVVRTWPDRPGYYQFDWLSGPNPDYGFAAQGSQPLQLTQEQIEHSIRDFLSSIDPDTGYMG